ncbi:UPF0764 protein C16orf89 homolog [Nasonia vitripennis]|uniref:Secreted protein n=1 Tax=Nasonia vitripennis TaxID=7425 RepID=A0A7M7HAC3_NASVI|nr:UPF0764 protein C16orf89 homolog [Nasonia vitripennis]
MDVKLIFLIFLYIYSITHQVISAKFDTNKFERKMLALMKVLKYSIERPEQMNMDTTFGVTFAQANIQAALRHKNVIYLDAYQKDVLENLLELSEDTRNLLHTYEKLPNKNVQELSFQLNRPEIWIKPIVWKKLDLTDKPLPNPDLTVDETVESMFRGHPQEAESDYCFINLVNHCEFPNECRDLIVHNDNATTGYPLTHRLLMIQLMNALECETKITQFTPYLVYEFCSLILQDLVNLEAMEFPHVGKDLALEQIFLCGLEGYLDFLNEHYEQLLLDWQHPSGCYSGIGHSVNYNWAKTRVRRSGGFTDFGCVNHATGLGAAALALFIRKDIELMV